MRQFVPFPFWFKPEYSKKKCLHGNWYLIQSLQVHDGVTPGTPKLTVCHMADLDLDYT